jgi:hypothetical protein
MNVVDGVIPVLFAVVLVWFWTHTRRQQKETLALGYSAFATVEEYRSEFVRVAGSWRTLDYPYVTYQNKEGVWQTERLKHATSSGQEFFVNQLLEVVKFDGILYYRPDLESWNLPILGIAAGLLIFGLNSLVPGLAQALGF